MSLLTNLLLHLLITRSMLIRMVVWWSNKYLWHRASSGSVIQSISCVILFLILFMMWYKHKENLPTGRIFGVFMIVLWSLRFGYEFLKENQVSFEDKLPLNMGQILSIPLVLVGILILIWSYRNQPNKTQA
ncbi:MAG: prolipoprotein diacylglyceryl transferase family protein [Cytophagales bacterium]|nr:prolipoprotein diacylglyceryl transferase family protein [Cytophagales bacterium]